METGAVCASCDSFMQRIASRICLSESCHARRIDLFLRSSSIGPWNWSMLLDRVNGRSCVKRMDRSFQKSCSEGDVEIRFHGFARKCSIFMAFGSIQIGWGSNEMVCNEDWILLRFW